MSEESDLVAAEPLGLVTSLAGAHLALQVRMCQPTVASRAQCCPLWAQGEVGGDSCCYSIYRVCTRLVEQLGERD